MFRLGLRISRLVKPQIYLFVYWTHRSLRQGVSLYIQHDDSKHAYRASRKQSLKVFYSFDSELGALLYHIPELCKRGFPRGEPSMTPPYLRYVRYWPGLYRVA